MSCCSLIVSVSILRCWSFVFIRAFWTWDHDRWKHTFAWEAGDSLHLNDDTAQSDHTQGFHSFFAFTLSCNRVKPAENKARSVLSAQLWCPLSTSSYYAVGAFPLWFASHLPPSLTVTPPSSAPPSLWTLRHICKLVQIHISSPAERDDG